MVFLCVEESGAVSVFSLVVTPCVCSGNHSHPGKIDEKAPLPGGADPQAFVSRCEHCILPLRLTTLLPHLSHYLWCTTSLLQYAPHFSPASPSFLFRDVTAGGRQSVRNSSLSANFSFFLDAMTSSLLMRFRFPSCNPSPCLRPQSPYKEGFPTQISTTLGQLLKLLGPAVPALCKPSPSTAMKLCVSALSLLLLVAAFWAPVLSAPSKSTPPVASSLH